MPPWTPFIRSPGLKRRLALGALLTAGVAWGEPAPMTGIRFRLPTRSGWLDGEFRRWRVLRASIDDAHPEYSAVDLAVDLTSFDTGEARHNRRVRGQAFLGVRRHRELIAHLRSARVEDGSHFVVTAVLQMGDRTHAVAIPFTLVEPAERRVVGVLTLQPADLGLIGADAALDDDRTLMIRIDAVVPPDSTATAAASALAPPAG